MYNTKVGLLRTDESFYYREDLGHHDNPHTDTHSRLEESKFRIVTQLSIDVMHQIDLGITKFILYAIKSGQIAETPSKAKFKELDLIFRSLAAYTPNDFASKPRP